MSIDPVTLAAAQALPPMNPLPPANIGEANPPPAGAGFAGWLDSQLRQVNAEITAAADDGVRRLAIGEPVSLHQVMINLERARLHFELVLQVRNKLLEAYQDLTRMQI
jgi:flagellar hook-basal body complex protein FliE